jgi:fructokinase
MPQQSLRIFDINLRQGFYDASLIEQSLQAANVLKLNNEELPIVVDLLQVMAQPIDDPLTPCAILLERFDLQMVALTRGEKGSLLINNEQRSSSHLGVKPAQIVDTVGAGDAFTAAVAIGLLLHKPLDEINAVANRRASYVCTQPGATPPVPRELGYDVDVNR